jgi:hypothetical protein
VRSGCTVRGLNKRRLYGGEAVDENAELEVAMRAMADVPSDDAWRALSGVLARSTLIVPMRVVDGEPTDEVVMLEAADGSRGLPAFTNWEALARWADEPGPYARLDAPLVARMALGRWPSRMRPLHARGLDVEWAHSTRFAVGTYARRAGRQRSPTA